MLRFVFAPLLLLLSLLPAPAAAQVVATFYSHELGDSFPHAFVVFKGKTVTDGTPVDINYGFTPKTVTPAILLGSVAGRLDIAEPDYVADSTPQFRVTLTDAQYAAMMAVVEAWRTRPSPSYNLNRANCVHFVGELARAAGLAVTFPKRLMKKPRSYLRELMRLNPQVTPVGG